MKLQSLQTEGLNLFTAYGEDHICINSVRYTCNLTLLPGKIIQNWTLGTFTTLKIEDFEFLASLGAEVVLLGTGNQSRYPSPALLQAFIKKQQSIEIMNMQSACRTYNILANEGRNVAAAILMA